MLDLLAGLAAVGLAAATGMSTAIPQGEAACILEGLPASVRTALAEVVAEADPARSAAAMQDNAGPARDALAACVQRYGWSDEQRRTAIVAFQYGVRLEAAAIRLRANGLAVEQASAMFEALPASMHDAIFGKRPMTQDEMQVLQAAFAELVDRLDGPDGNALSEYITARAGYGSYARELLSR